MVVLCVDDFVLAGMLAAEAAFGALSKDSDQQPSMELYWTSLKDSWVWKELHQVRNIRPVQYIIVFHPNATSRMLKDEEKVEISNFTQTYLAIFNIFKEKETRKYWQGELNSLPRKDAG